MTILFQLADNSKDGKKSLQLSRTTIIKTGSLLRRLQKSIVSCIEISPFCCVYKDAKKPEQHAH